MADFCQKCSIRIFGEDMKDLAGLCKEDEMSAVLCEGCGMIWVNSLGERVASANYNIGVVEVS